MERLLPEHPKQTDEENSLLGRATDALMNIAWTKLRPAVYYYRTIVDGITSYRVSLTFDGELPQTRRKVVTALKGVGFDEVTLVDRADF